MKDKKMDKKIPVIIPAYEPDERLIELINELIGKKINNIIVVNDGSNETYNEIFAKVEKLLEGSDSVLLVHERNQGKGRALKTAFKYVLENIPDAYGVITADSDGQHTPDSILKVAEAMNEQTEGLILGVRDFSDSATIPWKSRFGNRLTIKVFKMATGKKIDDTQTGLRGIPKKLILELLEIPGDRFEYETRMLIICAKKYNVNQVLIETIYDSKEEHQTHFRPVVDSFKIYSIFFEVFFKYLVSSLSSFLIDIILFAIICAVLRGNGGYTYTIIATVIARVLSAIYNYCMNYGFVFKSSEGRVKSMLKYGTLVVVQMMLSAALVTGINYLVINNLHSFVNESFIKMVVDSVLFFVSYNVQKRFVF